MAPKTNRSRSPQARGAAGPSERAAETATLAPRTASGEPLHRWTFLTNHAHVLIVLNSSPGLVLREVAARVGITERAVQRILQDLEEGGFIRREKVGRRNQYEVLTDAPLRHPIEEHRNIGDLLRLING
ncbi:MarR family transcriptional regulator [Roseiconus nitratireducens]|uniref:MarR family transcriptional regulator n=1 Tax=Roseiconus nitratireducens TaxID=2605748 RepID=A0A5M6DIR2_9BACT|nr:MarR family transcriptional regulator [Roseiconus nitratireducens]